MDSTEDFQQLRDLCLAHLRPPTYAGGSWRLNPDELAQAIIDSGWTKEN